MFGNVGSQHVRLVRARAAGTHRVRADEDLRAAEGLTETQSPEFPEETFGNNGERGAAGAQELLLRLRAQEAPRALRAQEARAGAEVGQELHRE